MRQSGRGAQRSGRGAAEQQQQHVPSYYDVVHTCVLHVLHAADGRRDHAAQIEISQVRAKRLIENEREECVKEVERGINEAGGGRGRGGRGRGGSAPSGREALTGVVITEEVSFQGKLENM